KNLHKCVFFLLSFLWVNEDDLEDVKESIWDMFLFMFSLDRSDAAMLCLLYVMALFMLAVMSLSKILLSFNSD
ncbi:hypothetical protein ACJX0J_020655, partial [Zea mays]